MKKEFKAIYENIKPDEDLLMNALDLTDKKALKQKHTVRKIVSCVICLAVIVSAGFGVNGYYNNDDIVTESESASIENAKPSKGGILVAYAQSSELIKLADNLEITEMPLLGNITIIDLNAPQSEIDEKNSCFEKIISDIEAELDKIGNTGKSIGMRAGITPMDNVKIRRCFLGDFLLDMPEDYSEIEKLKVYNSSKYAEVVLAVAASEDADFSTDFRHSNYVEATGAELQYSRESGHYDQGIGEYEINPGYQITWNPSYEFSQMVDANPQFDISTLTDKITFEVVYKNGDVSKASADISFDKNGNMLVQNGGYDYIISQE